MKHSARAQAVIELLQKVDDSRVPMDATTGDYMRARRYIGSGDRANIAERSYHIMRARARLSWWLEKAGAPVTPRNFVLAWLALGEGLDEARIAILFDGDTHAPQPLTDEEKTLIAALPVNGLNDPSLPEAVRAECPPQYEESLRAVFGADFAAEMHAMMTSAPLDLRVNIFRADRDAVRESLGKDSVRTESTPWSPWGLRVDGKVFLSKTKAFVKGLVEIQDEGSQLVAVLCGAQPGSQVLDYCAGAGGKTLALAAAMKNKGRIVAADIDKGRLERARPRFRRAGVADIIEVRPLSDEKNRKWLRRQKETFNAVLADVPCSSTGTWRRNPDLRWRSHAPPLAELLPVQADILDRVAKTVKPGGRLVYATCSLLPQENEEQIEAFLGRHQEFEIMPLAQAWPEGSTPPGDGPFLRLSPRRHNTDGFFAAVLRRKENAVAAETSGEDEAAPE